MLLNATNETLDNELSELNKQVRQVAIDAVDSLAFVSVDVDSDPRIEEQHDGYWVSGAIWVPKEELQSYKVRP